VTQYRSHPSALLELEEAAAWYDDQSTGLGEDLLAEFERCLAFALEMPGIGALMPAPHGLLVRKYRLTRFDRYAIVIAFLEPLPTFIAFEHSSRRPGYWLRRLG
jgi:toxin ParE1/3/4